MIVSGIYAQLDELRQLYDCESIEEILAGFIARKKQLNRLVELQGKATVTDDEHHDAPVLSPIRRGIARSGARSPGARRRSPSRKTSNGKNGKAKHGAEQAQTRANGSKNGIAKKRRAGLKAIAIVVTHDLGAGDVALPA
jgi:hypothetical protein